MTHVDRLTWLKEWYNDHRSELQTQPAMVAAIKKNHQLAQVIRELYFVLFNKPIGGCTQCLSDALIILLHKSTEKKIMEIMKCHFKLKQGVLLTDSKSKLPDATSANLTDEIAVAYLKDNPARASQFATIPEDWEMYGSQAPEATEADNGTTDADNSAQAPENQITGQNAEQTTEQTNQPEGKTEGTAVEDTDKNQAPEATAAPKPAKKTTSKRTSSKTSKK